MGFSRQEYWSGVPLPSTPWTWVWVNSGSWWWTGRPGVLRSMGSQRVGHDWVTELNWTELYFPLSKTLKGSKIYFSYFIPLHGFPTGTRLKGNSLHSLTHPKQLPENEHSAVFIEVISFIFYIVRWSWIQYWIYPTKLQGRARVPPSPWCVSPMIHHI